MVSIVEGAVAGIVWGIDTDKAHSRATAVEGAEKTRRRHCDQVAHLGEVLLAAPVVAYAGGSSWL